MQSLFQIITTSILNNPTLNFWVIHISKKITNNINQDHQNEFWQYKKGDIYIGIKEKNISLNYIADLFANSGLITNVYEDINTRSNKKIIRIKFKKNESIRTKDNLSPVWNKIWNQIYQTRINNQMKIIKDIRINRESQKLSSQIIEKIKQNPNAKKWEVPLPRYHKYETDSIEKIVQKLQNENFKVYLSKLITHPWMSNQVPLILLNICRKNKNHSTFLKYIANSTEVIEERFPDLVCPISQKIMQDAVMLGTTGHTYERSQITEALRRRPNKDPISNAQINDCTLTPNYALINTIKQIKEQNISSISNISNISTAPNSNNGIRIRSNQENNTRIYYI